MKLNAKFKALLASTAIAVGLTPAEAAPAMSNLHKAAARNRCLHQKKKASSVSAYSATSLRSASVDANG